MAFLRIRGGVAGAALLLFVACGVTRSNAPSPTSRTLALHAVERASMVAGRGALATPRDTAFIRRESAFVSEGYRSVETKRYSDLGVRLPAYADESTEVGVARFESLRLLVRLEGARASEGELHHGRVVYPDVLPDTHRIMVASASTFEEWIVLASPNSPRTFVWKMQLPSGIKEVVQNDGGGFDFLRPSGEPALRMPALVASDASGVPVRVRATWRKDDNALVASLDERDLSGAHYPVSLDPTFDTFAWLDQDTRNAIARFGASIAYDDARGEVVMFGGWREDPDNRATYNDTWIWNGSTWRRRLTGVSPSPRAYTSMVYDAARANIVLFGGLNWDALYNGDTWTWDGLTWKNVTPTSASPSPRSRYALTYDAARQETVLFGGWLDTYNAPIVPTVWHGDTWIWNGAQWTQRTTAIAPTARMGAKMAFDTVRNRAVLFGGQQEDRSWPNATWAWDGTQWSTLTTASSPPGRDSATMVFDVARNVMLLSGGENAAPRSDVWTFDGIDWTALPGVSPSARFQSNATYDRKHAQTVLYGGQEGETATLADTWTWDGAWHSASSAVHPSKRAFGSMTFDDARGNAVLYGGMDVRADDSFGPVYNETWTWDGKVWTKLTPATLPPTVEEPIATYDAARSEVVLFGGQTGPDAASGETWTWNGTNWSNRNVAGPPARIAHAMTFDGARNEVVLFGGLAYARFYVDDLWVWNGSQWTQRVTTTKPLARFSHALAYDAARHEVVLFGGFSSAGEMGDTHTWNGAAWTDRTPTLSPIARSRHLMMYDRDERRVLLFGGGTETSSSATRWNDLWAWDGKWTNLGFAGNAPAARESLMGTFDPVRHQVVIFGGLQYRAVFSDTWIGTTLGKMCASEADCLAGFCTNGTCCNVAMCGTCGTCNGTSPGRCTAVTNAEDPTTCALTSGKSCDAQGTCKKALGTMAAAASECASGFVSDGVCCNEPCNGTCQACRADLKETADRTGTCGPTRGGADPHDNCATEPNTTCRGDGTCDGRGACRVYKSGTACGDGACVDNRATGQVCDGLGACVASAVGVECALYACVAGVGCAATCTGDESCGSRAHCDAGQCVANEGATCTNSRTLVEANGVSLDCAPYACEGAACRIACVSVKDCVYPAQCSSDGKCVPFAESAAPDGSGCSVATREAPSNLFWWSLLGLAVFKRRVRRRASPRASQ